MRARGSIAAFLVVVACGDSFPQPQPQPPPPDVDPDAAPEIVVFSASSLRIRPRESVELSWEVKNARAIEIFDEDATLVSTFAATGQHTTPPLRYDRKYFLRAVNREKVATAELTIIVEWVPPTIEFVRTTQDLVLIDNAVELSWGTTKADIVRVELDGTEVYSQEVDVDSGSTFIAITKPLTRVKLIASNPSGTVSEELDVHGMSIPSITRLAIHPRVWLGGTQTATLSWQTRDATTLVLTHSPLPSGETVEVGGVVGSEGSIAILLRSEGYYQFSALNDVGSTHHTAYVELPTIESEPNDVPESAGFTRAGALGEISTVNDIDYYTVRFSDVLSGLRIETRGVDGSGDCAVDTMLTASDAEHNVVFSASEGRCVRFEITKEEIAMLSSFNPYLYVAVQSENNETGSYALFTEEL